MVDAIWLEFGKDTYTYNSIGKLRVAKSVCSKLIEKNLIPEKGFSYNDFIPYIKDSNVDCRWDINIASIEAFLEKRLGSIPPGVKAALSGITDTEQKSDLLERSIRLLIKEENLFVDSRAKQKVFLYKMLQIAGRDIKLDDEFKKTFINKLVLKYYRKIAGQKLGTEIKDQKEFEEILPVKLAPKFEIYDGKDLILSAETQKSLLQHYLNSKEAPAAIGTDMQAVNKDVQEMLIGSKTEQAKTGVAVKYGLTSQEAAVYFAYYEKYLEEYSDNADSEQWMKYIEAQNNPLLNRAVRKYSQAQVFWRRYSTIFEQVLDGGSVAGMDGFRNQYNSILAKYIPQMLNILATEEDPALPDVDYIFNKISENEGAPSKIEVIANSAKELSALLEKKTITQDEADQLFHYCELVRTGAVALFDEKDHAAIAGIENLRYEQTQDSREFQDAWRKELNTKPDLARVQRYLFERGALGPSADMRQEFFMGLVNAAGSLENIQTILTGLSLKYEGFDLSALFDLCMAARRGDLEEISDLSGAYKFDPADKELMSLKDTGVNILSNISGSYEPELSIDQHMFQQLQSILSKNGEIYFDEAKLQQFQNATGSTGQQLDIYNKAIAAFIRDNNIIDLKPEDAAELNSDKLVVIVNKGENEKYVNNEDVLKCLSLLKILKKEGIKNDDEIKFILKLMANNMLVQDAMAMITPSDNEGLNSINQTNLIEWSKGLVTPERAKEIIEKNYESICRSLNYDAISLQTYGQSVSRTWGRYLLYDKKDLYEKLEQHYQADIRSYTLGNVVFSSWRGFLGFDKLRSVSDRLQVLLMYAREVQYSKADQVEKLFFGECPPEEAKQILAGFIDFLRANPDQKVIDKLKKDPLVFDNKIEPKNLNLLAKMDVKGSVLDVITGDKDEANPHQRFINGADAKTAPFAFLKLYMTSKGIRL
ncbi:MAG: hypothetical protein ABIH39_07755, partial [Candidatus Margulisiibacteriota bacterium]